MGDLWFVAHLRGGRIRASAPLLPIVGCDDRSSRVVRAGPGRLVASTFLGPMLRIHGDRASLLAAQEVRRQRFRASDLIDAQDVEAGLDAWASMENAEAFADL